MTLELPPDLTNLLPLFSTGRLAPQVGPVNLAETAASGVPGAASAASSATVAKPVNRVVPSTRFGSKR